MHIHLLILNIHLYLSGVYLGLNLRTEMEKTCAFFLMIGLVVHAQNLLIIVGSIVNIMGKNILI